MARRPIRLVVVSGCMFGQVSGSVSVSWSYLVGRSGLEDMPTLWSGSGPYDDKLLRHGHDCQSSQDSCLDLRSGMGLGLGLIMTNSCVTATTASHHQDSWQDGVIRLFFDQALVYIYIYINMSVPYSVHELRYLFPSCLVLIASMSLKLRGFPFQEPHVAHCW